MLFFLLFCGNQINMYFCTPKNMQMSKFVEYRIPFKGLAEGKHDFSFAVRDMFFQDMQSEELKKGSVDVELVFDKQQRLFILDFSLKGYVEIPCDRCLEDFHQTVEMDYTMYVKYGEDDGSDDDIIWIDEEAHELELQEIIYELIILSLPIKRVHPNLENGEEACQVFEIDEEQDQDTNTDPRWDALKGLNLEN